MKKNDLNLLINVLLLFSIFLSASGFLMDLRNTALFGGVDLRNRVVGARLLIDHQDPYHYKWERGDSVLFLDPRDNPDWEVNRVTVPPTVLVFHAVIAKLSYKTQRYIWFIFQWVLFIASLFLFSKCTNSVIKSKIIWVCGLFFIGSSFYWRLHVERGQIYILYMFLLSLSYWVYCKKLQNSEFLSGMVAGITISFRPPLMLLALPMILYKKFKFVLGNVAGVIVGLVASLVIASPQTWIQYFNAMKMHGSIHFNFLYASSSQYPYQNIEGISNLWGLAHIPIFDTSLQFMARSVGLNLTSNILFALLIVTLTICCFAIRKIIGNETRFSFIVLSGIILVFIAEYFMPAARFSYNNVILLPILSLVIIDSERILKSVGRKWN